MYRSQEIRKYVIGHKIVEVRLNAIRNQDEIIYDPVIVLDNGVRLFFITQESRDGGDYGVSPIVNITELRR